jgi:hypothetical protein
VFWMCDGIIGCLQYVRLQDGCVGVAAACAVAAVLTGGHLVQLAVSSSSWAFCTQALACSPVQLNTVPAVGWYCCMVIDNVLRDINLPACRKPVMAWLLLAQQWQRRKPILSQATKTMTPTSSHSSSSRPQRRAAPQSCT